MDKFRPEASLAIAFPARHERMGKRVVYMIDTYIIYIYICVSSDLRHWESVIENLLFDCPGESHPGWSKESNLILAPGPQTRWSSRPIHFGGAKWSRTGFWYYIYCRHRPRPRTWVTVSWGRIDYPPKGGCFPINKEICLGSRLQVYVINGKVL